MVNQAVKFEKEDLKKQHLELLLQFEYLFKAADVTTAREYGRGCLRTSWPKEYGPP